MNIQDILERSQAIEDAIGGLSRQLSEPGISEEYRADLEMSLAGYRAEYDALQSEVDKAFADGGISDVTAQAFEAVYGNDEERIQAAVDDIRAGMADGKEFGDAFRDTIGRDAGVDGAVGRENTSDGADRDGTDRADSSDRSDSRSANADGGSSDRIEMDEKSRDALFNIFDGDEEKMQAAYEYLYEHYDGEGVSESDILDKIHDTVNYANRCDPASLGFDSREQALGEKVAYDDRKVDFEATKGKYLFRNTFALGDKLAFNLEAFRTGLPGADGKPVTGGTIAMNIIELSRSNIFDSFIEMALRDYFDKKYPAKEAQVDRGTENAGAGQGADNGFGKDTKDDTVKDFSGVVRDDGYAIKGYEKSDVGMDKDNPAAGVHFGADTSRGPMDRDGIKVWSTDKPSQETYVDKTRDTGTDQTGKLRVPAMQLVEVQGNKYLVDPVGKATPVDIANPKTAYNLDIDGQAYIRDFDISATRRGAEAVAAVAEGKGLSVDAYKAELSTEAKEAYVAKTLDMQDKHGEYLEKVAIPETKETADAYREKIGQVEKYNEGLRTEIAGIEKNYDGNQHKTEDVEKVQSLKSELSKNEAVIEKFKVAAEKMDSRVAAMEKTVDGYKDAKLVAESDKTDLDARFYGVISGERLASGRTGEVDYGIGKEDARDMAAAIEHAYDAEKPDAPEGIVDVPEGNQEADAHELSDTENMKGEVESDTANVDKSDVAEQNPDNKDGAESNPVSTEPEDKADAKESDETDAKERSSADVDAGTDKTEPKAASVDEKRPEVGTEVSGKDVDKPESAEKTDISSDTKSPMEKELAIYREKADEALHGNSACFDLEAQVSYLEADKRGYQEQLADLNGKRDPASLEYRETFKTALKDAQAKIDGLKAEITKLDAESVVGDRLLVILGNDSLSIEQKLDAAHGFAESMGLSKDEIEQIRVDAGYSSDDKENNITSEQQQESRIEAEDADKAIAADDNMRVEMQHLEDTDKDTSKAVEQNDPSKAIEQNDPSKAVEQTDPSKAVEANDPSKAVENEGQEKQIEQEDPSKNIEQEDSDKAAADEGDKAIEAEADNTGLDAEDVNRDLDETQDLGADEPENQLETEPKDDATIAELDNADADKTAEQVLEAGDVDRTGADDDVAAVSDADFEAVETDDKGDGPVDANEQNEAVAGSATNDEVAEKAVENEDDESRIAGGSVAEQKKSDEDDAAVVSDNQISKEDISDALDKYLNQGSDNVYSFEDDFLKANAGNISQDDLYDACKEKIAEVEVEIKNGDADEDKTARMSDVLDSIRDFSIENFAGQIEKLGDFLEALSSGDMETAGNMIIEDWLGKLEGQLEPLSKIADVINEHLGDEAGGAGLDIKEAVVDRLDNLDFSISDTNMEAVANICDTIGNIFEGFTNLVAGMMEHYGADAAVDVSEPGVDMGGVDFVPSIETVDFGNGIYDVAEQLGADIPESFADPDIAAPDTVPDMSPDFAPDFDISDYSLSDNFDSFVDVMQNFGNGVENALANAVESGADAEAVEEIAALLL